MDAAARGWINGFVGMLIFSGTLPATKMAVAELDPLFVTLARATIAGCLGGALLLALRARRPGPDDIRPLMITATCVVVGFPLLTALALRHITSAHSLVYIGLLPLSTALFGVLRGGERPRPAFWVFSILGSALVVVFALAQGGTTTMLSDLLMLVAIVAGGLGYAEGAALSRTLGGWQVVSWALVLSLPIMAPLMLIAAPTPSWGDIDLPSWLGLAYVSLFSMLIGFVFWYRGLALGGIAAVGQLQLLQPFFGMAIAAALLNEKVSGLTIAIAVGVNLCIAGAKRFGSMPTVSTK